MVPRSLSDIGQGLFCGIPVSCGAYLDVSMFLLDEVKENMFGKCNSLFSILFSLKSWKEKKLASTIVSNLSLAFYRRPFRDSKVQILSLILKVGSMFTISNKVTQLSKF